MENVNIYKATSEAVTTEQQNTLDFATSELEILYNSTKKWQHGATYVTIMRILSINSKYIFDQD